MLYSKLKVMLADKRSADVTPEVNLRIQLQPGEEARLVRGSILALEPRADVTIGLKQGHQYPTKRTDLLQNFEKKVRNKLDTDLCGD